MNMLKIADMATYRWGGPLLLSVWPADRGIRPNRYIHLQTEMTFSSEETLSHSFVVIMGDHFIKVDIDLI